MTTRQRRNRLTTENYMIEVFTLIVTAATLFVSVISLTLLNLDPPTR